MTDQLKHLADAMDTLAKVPMLQPDNDARTIAALKERVLWLENERRWYAADDPPEDNRDIILFLDSEMFMVGYFNGSKFCNIETYNVTFNKVLAWTELPKPPKSPEDLSRREPQPKGEK